jgi:hypothetical protein
MGNGVTNKLFLAFLFSDTDVLARYSFNVRLCYTAPYSEGMHFTMWDNMMAKVSLVSYDRRWGVSPAVYSIVRVWRCKLRPCLTFVSPIEREVVRGWMCACVLLVCLCACVEEVHVILHLH